jgi:hypothetical protein
MLLYTLDVHPKVTEILKAAELVHPRIQEAFMALKWRLAREPYKGFALVGTQPLMRLFKLQLQYQSLSSISVRYSVDKVNHKVIICDMRIED